MIHGKGYNDMIDIMGKNIHFKPWIERSLQINMHEENKIEYHQQKNTAFHEYTRIRLKELGFHLLSSWKLIIGIGLLLSIIIGVLSFFVITPVYQATATFYVLEANDFSLNFSDLQKGEALTQDYIRLFGMWEVHEAVRSQLDSPTPMKIR